MRDDVQLLLGVLGFVCGADGTQPDRTRNIESCAISRWSVAGGAEMTSPDGCVNRKPYKSRHDAIKAADKQENPHKVYCCKVCAEWHIEPDRRGE